MDLAAADRYLREHRSRHLEELKDFLRIPSVSALPRHRDDVDRAARWAADRLRAAGVPDVRVLPTGGSPAVFGHWPADPARPTVLIYGHYDVQPVDPEGLWQSPPFDPVERDGRLYARGASDDKGNAFIPIAALEALRAVAGGPPVNVKFLIEGEEEVGSPHLPDCLRRYRDLLAADVVLAADGDMWDADTPALHVGSRGIAALQIDVRGPRGDLHSGIHGGAVQNPIHALAELLAGMRGPDGRIRVEGFYDGVRPLSAEERRRFAEVPFDEEAYRRELGVPALWGEAGYTTLERRWARPTLEVNGIWGGFQGEGIKTVLPAEAHAKITCRLVPDQDPERVLEAIERHVREHAPPGVEVAVRRFPGSSRPYLMPLDHPALEVAGRVLAEVYGRPPVVVRTGGTLPVAELVRRELGVWLVFFSFGEPDNQVHAPDEFLRLQSFDRGTRAYVRLLAALAQVPPERLRAG